MTLIIDSIKRNGGTQTRAILDRRTVHEYRESLQSGAVFPPITVYYDGSDYWLADGFHRVAATRQAGGHAIEADVIQGSRRDAILHSVGANSDHGLRRTNADKRRAVETLLRDEEWSQWSDREIARRCSVNDKTVGNIRRELSAENPQMHTERKVERNGTVYTQKTENIGNRSERVVDPGRRPEPEEPFSWTRDEGKRAEPEEPGYSVTVDEAFDLIVEYLGYKLEALHTATERHELINRLLKHVRTESVAMNRAGVAS